MNDAQIWFLREFFPQLAAYLVVALMIIWFPWKRLHWLPHDSSHVESKAKLLLSAGDKAGAIRLLRRSYCVPPNFAEAIVESLDDHKPNKALEPTLGSVTPRAVARVAPAPIVAHL